MNYAPAIEELLKDNEKDVREAAAQSCASLFNDSSSWGSWKATICWARGSCCS